MKRRLWRVGASNRHLKGRRRNANTLTIRGDCSALRKHNFALEADRLNPSGLSFRIQSLNTKQDYRGASRSGERKMSVKVVSESDTNPICLPRRLENLRVFGLRQSDLTDVDRVNAANPKNRRRTRRESLVEQNRDHATRSMLKLSSSTVAAA